MKRIIQLSFLFLLCTMNSQNSCVSGDCDSGEGMMTFEDGSTYEGVFKFGKPHGEGTFIESNGNSYSGKFFLGKRDGVFKVMDKNGNQLRDIQYISDKALPQKDDANLSISKITRLQHFTVIQFKYTSPANSRRPTASISIDTYIQDINGGKKYYIEYANGMLYAPDRRLINGPGETVTFDLIFPKLDESIKNINIIECPERTNCFNIYNVPLDDYGVPINDSRYDVISFNARKISDGGAKIGVAKNRIVFNKLDTSKYTSESDDFYSDEKIEIETQTLPELKEGEGVLIISKNIKDLGVIKNSDFLTSYSFDQYKFEIDGEFYLLFVSKPDVSLISEEGSYDIGVKDFEGTKIQIAFTIGNRAFIEKTVENYRRRVD